METALNKIRVNRYPAYKDSGVEWLGEIPEHWALLPGFAVFEERNEKNSGLEEDNVLSLSFGKIIIKPKEKLTGLVPESFETYQKVYPGDIIIRPTDLQNDKTSLRVGIAKNRGIITSAYLNFKTRNGYFKLYYYYFFHSIDITKVIYGLGTGLRQNLSFIDFKKFNFLCPNQEEQIRISDFLDRKTAQIDKAIAHKERIIELLKEKRQILIQRAVTRGLDPDVKMKDSGVEWIGEIPEQWEVKRLKDICSINRDSLPETTKSDFSFNYVDISSVTFETGIFQTEEYTFKDAPSRARRIARKGDTVISTVRTYLKAIDYVNERKSTYIYSTGFAVLHPKKYVHSEFMAIFVKSNAFTEQVMVNSKGMSYPAINSSELGRLYIVHGNINEQQAIVKYINEHSSRIFHYISIKESEIEKLKEFKATLINSVVTGKIKV